MAVDLSNLIDSLRREVNPPGENLFPNATEDDLIGHLQDAFWEARLDGLLPEYTEDGGLVTPDLPRDLQQLVVFYAGFRIVRNHLRNLNVTFRSKAGAVEFETQKSANVFKELLLELKRKRDLILTRLSDIGKVDSYYVDAIIARTDSMFYGDTWFARGS